MEKVILFGGSGYIGSEFRNQLGDKIISVPSHKWFYGYKNVLEFLRGQDVNYVINAAGFTGKPNVDACEAQKDKCYFGNVIFPLWIAQACEQLKITFGHVSSGCIYNGYEKHYTETDEPDFSFKQNNCSFYSGTKAQSEELLRDFPNTYIWRLRIPFNNENSPRNYLTKMLNYKKILNLANSVSQKEEFVSTCLKTLEHNIPSGIYNLTNKGYTDAKSLFELFSKHRPEFNEVISSKEYFADIEDFMKTSIAARSNCILNTDKLESFGLGMRPVEEALTEAVKNYRSA